MAETSLAPLKTAGGDATTPRSGRRAWRGAAPPLVLLAAWETASHTGLVSPRFLPPLENLVGSVLNETTGAELLRDLLISLKRDLLGFAIGTSVGVAAGLTLGLSRLADRIVMPWFNGLKQIALVAWIPLISVWFGFDEAAKIAFIALAACIPVVLNTVEGVRSAPLPLAEVGQALKFTRWQFVRKLYLPAAIPSVITGIHLALIYSWLATIGAEYFLAIGPGIGGLIIAGRERFHMEMVMLGVLLVGVVGYAIDRVATALERRLVWWRTE